MARPAGARAPTLPARTRTAMTTTTTVWTISGYPRGSLHGVAYLSSVSEESSARQILMSRRRGSGAHLSRPSPVSAGPRFETVAPVFAAGGASRPPSPWTSPFEAAFDRGCQLDGVRRYLLREETLIFGRRVMNLFAGDFQLRPPASSGQLPGKDSAARSARLVWCAAYGAMGRRGVVG